jgi:hypothetical protein
MTKIDWNKAAKAAKRAATRFAPVYGALDWEWSSGGIGAEIREVPSEARILQTLWAMVADVHAKLVIHGKIVGEDGIHSYGTGGLSVTLDNEGTLHFVMDVTESEFGCVTHAQVAETP